MKIRKLIQATRRTSYGSLPNFLHFAHRSLEKSQQACHTKTLNTDTFKVSKEILNLTVKNSSVLDGISHIELTYKK
jgi:hypothetical protein